MLVKRVFLELFALHKEGSTGSENVGDDGHVEEVFGCGNMGTFDFKSEENVAGKQEINVGFMSGDDDQRPIFFEIVISKELQFILIEHYFFIDLPKHLVHEPGHEADCVHLVLCEHHLGYFNALLI